MKNSFDFGKKFHEFVENNAKADPKSLYLSLHGKDCGFPVEKAIIQIECRRKSRQKLGRFCRVPEFMFPSVLASEQATHQCVAAYHAKLAGEGKRIADITAGLGIDAFTLASNGCVVTAMELDPERAEALRHNVPALSETFSAGRVGVVEGDSLEWLRCHPEEKFDILFADPARRDGDNKRTYFLKDCLPDVVANYPLLAAHAPKIMVKASPIVDLKQAVRELPSVTELHLVCVKGECKELLVVSEPDSDTGAVVKAADLDETPDGSLSFISDFACEMDDLGKPGQLADAQMVRHGAYIYDPNAAIHKLNCGEKLCRDFPGLYQLGLSTSLFISDELHTDFPGRVFRVMEIPDKKGLKRLKGARIEVLSRNYPLATAELRKKLGVKSGDDAFAVGARAGREQKPTIMLCQRVKKFGSVFVNVNV